MLISTCFITHLRFRHLFSSADLNNNLPLLFVADYDDDDDDDNDDDDDDENDSRRSNLGVEVGSQFVTLSPIKPTLASLISSEFCFLTLSLSSSIYIFFVLKISAVV